VIARTARWLPLVVLALLLLGAAGAPAFAAPGHPAKPGPPAKPAAQRPAAKPGATDGAGSTKARARLAPRTLDDIHIEGEIPVPQVLFITARDQRRFMEFQHHRYARTSLELGRGTAMPSRVVVPEPSPAERKENQR
jgi:hypothetical protein